MKRTFYILALTVVLLGAMLYLMPKSFDKFAIHFSQDAKITVYCTETSLQAINVGNGFLVECERETFAETFAKCDNVQGISVKFEGNTEDFWNVVRRLNLNITSRQRFDNLVVLCGKSSKIAGGVWLDGNLVNVQIAFDGKNVTVGSPLILDSY